MGCSSEAEHLPSMDDAWVQCLALKKQNKNFSMRKGSASVFPTSAHIHQGKVNLCMLQEISCLQDRKRAVTRNQIGQQFNPGLWPPQL